MGSCLQVKFDPTCSAVQYNYLYLKKHMGLVHTTYIVLKPGFKHESGNLEISTCTLIHGVWCSW